MPARAWTAIVIAAACALIAAGQHFAGAMEPKGDHVALYEQRYAPLRAALPPRATVGYVTDLPGENMQAWTEFAMLQYAVAPVIVVKRADLPLVIGNLHAAQAIVPVILEHRLRVDRDLGLGVFLLKR